MTGGRVPAGCMECIRAGIFGLSGKQELSSG